MRSALFFRRVTATVTAASLLLANGFVPPAAAQPAPPPGAQPAPAPGPNQANPNQPNPPGRVGRLAVVNGTVSFHGAEADHWDPATLNFPVTSGDSFWTEPGAQAEIEVAGNRMMLAEQTELDVNVLDDHSFQSTEPQGEVYLNLTAVAQGESYTVKTPRGMVTLTQGGRYDIAAGDVDHPTLVTVIEGAAQVSDDGLSLQVGPDQTATITGTDTFQGTVGASVRDAFLIETMQAEQPPPPPPQGGVAPPAVVSQMTGCAQLARYGTWRSTPQYGTVWYPQADPGFVPYRNGRWAYVQPWGWTWVDAAPWGFAPFHYGRWVETGGGWGWTPVLPGVAVVTPVYAPALVTFFGIGAAVGVGVGIGLGIGAIGGSIGWAPLGFRQPYYPPYGANANYIRNINAGNVTNVNNINVTRNVTNNINNGTINRNGATVVPASAMTSSAPVAGAVQHVTPQQLASARPVVGQNPVQPTANTFGASRATLQRVSTGGAAAGVPAAGAAGAVAGTGRNGLPALATPGAAAAARAPGAPIATRGAGVPAAGTPGAAGAERPAVTGAERPAVTGAPGPAIGGTRANGLPELRSATPAAGAQPGAAGRPGGTAVGSVTPNAATPNAVRPQGEATRPQGEATPQAGRPNATATPENATARPQAVQPQRQAPAATANATPRQAPQQAPRATPQVQRQASAPSNPQVSRPPQAQVSRPAPQPRQAAAPPQPRPQQSAPRPAPAPHPQAAAPHPAPHPKPEKG
jgi:hypothetical protein